MKIHSNTFVGIKFKLFNQIDLPNTWIIDKPRKSDGHYGLIFSQTPQHKDSFQSNGEWWPKDHILYNFKNGNWIKI